MHFRVRHQTRYRYHSQVSLCYNELRLVPRELPHQTLINSRIAIEPGPSALRERTDYFGNRVYHFGVQRPHSHLTVTVENHVRIEPPGTVLDPSASPAWEAVADRLCNAVDAETISANEFCNASELIVPTDAMAAFADRSLTPGRPVLEAARDLMGLIHGEFEFKPGFTTVSTPLTKVLEQRRGVCQDFAQLAIGCMRSKGLAARYVSGYIETLPPPGKEKLKGADASHAWFSIYVPGSGWFDYDPTNDLVPSDRHIVVGWGRDYADVTPLKGVLFGGGRHELEVSVDVEPLDGPPADPSPRPV